MENKELNYVVKLIKSDGSSIDLVETNEFNRAKSAWKLAYEQWMETVADRRPYIIEEPAENGYITAFDPSLIREILILPLEKQKHEDNPYKRRMQAHGFSATFPVGGGDILDGGYR